MTTDNAELCFLKNKIESQRLSSAISRDRECRCGLTQTQLIERKNQHRQAIEALKKKGLTVSQNGNTIYTKGLSPGCQLCKQGKWTCMFITNACTRKCFYCPQKTRRVALKDETVYIEDATIKNEQDLVQCISTLKARGCGISGGETLLALDRVLRYVSCIKRTFSPFHVWLYTNGDLINESTLAKLKDAGLDEIRFDLAANGYQIEPVMLARRYFKNVAVEIPIIPGDEDKVIELIDKLGRMGVYFNLHELMFAGCNATRLKKRSYKGVSLWPPRENLFHDERPVYGSNEAALKILNHVLDSGMQSAVNYCSANYKFNVQQPLRRRALSKAFKLPHEKITKDGYCEKLIIYGPGLKQIKSQLLKNGVRADHIHECQENDRLELHVDCLKHLDLSKHMVGLCKSKRSFAQIKDASVRILEK